MAAVRARTLASRRNGKAASAAPVAAKDGKPGRKVSWDEGAEDLYVRWHRRVAAVQEGHHRLSDRFNRRYIALGLPVVVLSTVVGTSAFATLQDDNAALPAWVKFLVGTVGVLAAVLASAQTFFGYAQRAEQHRVAAVRYETLRRDMAQQLALPDHARREPGSELNSVGSRMDKYAKESPNLPEKLWHSLCAEFGIDTVPPPVD